MEWSRGMVWCGKWEDRGGGGVGENIVERNGVWHGSVR